MRLMDILMLGLVVMLLLMQVQVGWDGEMPEIKVTMTSLPPLP